MRDFENLYHCNMCQTVVLLEESDRKVLRKCITCDDYGTHFRVNPGGGEV